MPFLVKHGIKNLITIIHLFIIYVGFDYCLPCLLVVLGVTRCYQKTNGSFRRLFGCEVMDKKRDERKSFDILSLAHFYLAITRKNTWKSTCGRLSRFPL